MGNGNFLMAGAHVGHNATVGNNVILANNVLVGGFAEIGDRAFLGGGSVYHQHVRVGQLAISQGNSAFSKDLPPFTIGSGVNQVVGLNIVGMRRAGLAAGDRAEVKEAFKILYKSGLNVRQALERARERKWHVHGRAFFDFAAAPGKRGLCGLLQKRRLDDKKDTPEL